MAKTSTERMADLRKRRRALGLKLLGNIWITDEEKKIIKPMIEEKIKELRKEKEKKI